MNSQQLVIIHEIIFNSMSDCFAEIDLKGSIILCRYGGIFRGLKVSLFPMSMEMSTSMVPVLPQVKGAQGEDDGCVHRDE